MAPTRSRSRSRSRSRLGRKRPASTRRRSSSAKRRGVTLRRTTTLSGPRLSSAGRAKLRARLFARRHGRTAALGSLAGLGTGLAAYGAYRNRSPCKTSPRNGFFLW